MKALPIDKTAAYELFVVADNEAEIYKRYLVPAARAVARHAKRGTYDAEKAVAAFVPAMTETAKLYGQRHMRPGEWATVFSVATRREAARLMLDHMQDEIMSGEVLTWN